MRLFCGDVINTSPVVLLLVAGTFVRAWCSFTLSLIWCIGAWCITLLVGALLGIVPSMSTAKAGDLPRRVGLDSTIVRRFDYWLDLLLRLIILVEHRVLVLLLLKVGSCSC